MQDNISDSSDASRDNEDEINLLDYLIILAKRKRLIIGFTLGLGLFAAIATIALHFTKPPKYHAQTKILPPKSRQGMALQFLTEKFGPMAEYVGGSLGVQGGSELYIGLLKSKPVFENVIKRFNLIKVYKVKDDDEKMEEELFEDVDIKYDKKTSIMTIKVTAKDPKLAADMANAFVEEFENLLNNLAITETSKKRVFFEKQLAMAKESLIQAEESLKGFQEKTGAIKIEEQARGVFEGIARLRAEIASREVQLRVMKSYATSQNPDIQKVETEIAGLREQLGRLAAKGSSHNPDAVIPTGRMPSLGTEYIRKMREFKYNEALYEILLKQYEAARLDEARDAAFVQVLEKAVPTKKKPKRFKAIIGGIKRRAVLAMFAGFFFSVFAAFFLEYREKAAKDPVNKERLETLKRYLKSR